MRAEGWRWNPLADREAGARQLRIVVVVAIVVRSHRRFGSSAQRQERPEMAVTARVR
jgi:hypothetical protein